MGGRLRKVPRTVVTLIASLAMAASAAAQQTSVEDAYRWSGEVWRGYASIATCIKGRDAYQLGPYIFACTGYDYLYHYGNVVLSAAHYVTGGRTFMVGKLCLERKDNCLQGEVYLASAVSSPREVTRECRDARQEAKQSAARLSRDASDLQECLRTSGLKDDCESQVSEVQSGHSRHARNIREVKNACE